VRIERIVGPLIRTHVCILVRTIPVPLQRWTSPADEMSTACKVKAGNLPSSCVPPKRCRRMNLAIPRINLAAGWTRPSDSPYYAARGTDYDHR